MDDVVAKYFYTLYWHGVAIYVSAGTQSPCVRIRIFRINSVADVDINI
jgi:hypothetical protein